MDFQTIIQPQKGATPGTMSVLTRPDAGQSQKHQTGDFQALLTREAAKQSPATPASPQIAGKAQNTPAQTEQQQNAADKTLSTDMATAPALPASTPEGATENTADIARPAEEHGIQPVTPPELADTGLPRLELPADYTTTGPLTASLAFQMSPTLPHISLSGHVITNPDITPDPVAPTSPEDIASHILPATDGKSATPLLSALPAPITGTSAGQTGQLLHTSAMSVTPSAVTDMSNTIVKTTMNAQSLSDMSPAPAMAEVPSTMLAQSANNSAHNPSGPKPGVSGESDNSVLQAKLAAIRAAAGGAMAGDALPGTLFDTAQVIDNTVKTAARPMTATSTIASAVTGSSFANAQTITAPKSGKNGGQFTASPSVQTASGIKSGTATHSYTSPDIALTGADSTAALSDSIAPRLASPPNPLPISAAPIPMTDSMADSEILAGQTGQIQSSHISSQAAKDLAMTNSRQTAQSPAMQVGLGIVKATADGTTRFTIRMDPPELGRIEVKLDMLKNGGVRALITADTPDTLDLLQRDARSLERILADSGIKTDSNSLDFSLNQQSRDQQMAAFADMAEKRGGQTDETKSHSGDEDAAMIDLEPEDQTIGFYTSDGLNIVI